MRRLLSLLLAAMTAATTLVAVGGPATADTSGAPTLLGFATGSNRYEDLDAFARDAGRPPSLYHLFWDRTKGFPGAWVAQNLQMLEDRGMLAVIEWTTDDLAGMARGDEDAAIRGLFESMAFWLRERPGRGVVIAPLPEPNLTGHPWGGDPAGFKAAYNRFRHIAADMGLGRDTVRFAWIVNGVNSAGFNWQMFYPGDAAVDLVGFNRLNRGDPWRDYDDMFGQRIRAMQAEISRSKPIIVGQTGSVTTGGDRAAWLRAMFSGLAAEEQVVGAVWFNRAKTEGGRFVDYRVVDSAAGMALDPTFRTGYATWSDPAQHDWLFDGRLDAWVTGRGGTPSDAPATSGVKDGSECQQRAPGVPALLGLSTPNTRLPADHDALAAAAGVRPTFVQQTWTLESGWPNPDYVDRLDLVAGRGMTIYAEIVTNDLAALARGDRDRELDALIDSIAPWYLDAPGRRLVVAPLPNPNVAGSPWSGDPVRYREAFARIRSRFAAAGLDRDVVRWVYSVAATSSKGRTMAEAYPGDGRVDLLGVAGRNTGSPWAPWTTLIGSGVDRLGREIGTDKPVLVTNVGTADDGSGGRADFLGDLFGCGGGHPRVIGAVYFNHLRQESVGQVDYRVITDAGVERAFADGTKGWSKPTEVAWLDRDLDAWVRANGGLPAARFGDSHASNLLADIVWLVDAGITIGCGVDRYCPNDPVTRGQMARFLDRAFAFPTSSVDAYRDDNATTHEAAINDGAAAGVTHPCGALAYCPGEPLHRDVMAFLLDAALELPVTTKDHFTDDEGSPYEGAIDRVAAAGITLGCGGGRYCPDATVTRAQMAAFLRRALAG